MPVRATTRRRRKSAESDLEEELTPRQQRDLETNRVRVTRGQAPLDFSTLAERVATELHKRGRYAWQDRESLRESLGMTQDEMKAALGRLLDEYRIERMGSKAKYRLNNARHVQAAP